MAVWDAIIEGFGPASTISLPPLPLAAPINLVATSGENAQVTLTWSPVAPTVGNPGPMQYALYWHPISTATVSAFPPTNVITGITVPSYVHTGLTNFHNYVYVVQAVDMSTGAVSTYSNEARGIPWTNAAAAHGIQKNGGYELQITDLPLDDGDYRVYVGTDNTGTPCHGGSYNAGHIPAGQTDKTQGNRLGAVYGTGGIIRVVANEATVYTPALDIPSPFIAQSLHFEQVTPLSYSLTFTANTNTTYEFKIGEVSVAVSFTTPAPALGDIAERLFEEWDRLAALYGTNSDPGRVVVTAGPSSLTVTEAGSGATHVGVTAVQNITKTAIVTAPTYTLPSAIDIHKYWYRDKTLSVRAVLPKWYKTGIRDLDGVGPQ